VACDVQIFVQLESWIKYCGQNEVFVVIPGLSSNVPSCIRLFVHSSHQAIDNFLFQIPKAAFVLLESMNEHSKPWDNCADGRLPFLDELGGVVNW
jgi:hypothetical protein